MIAALTYRILHFLKLAIQMTWHGLFLYQMWRSGAGNMSNLLIIKRFLSDESGQGITEYGAVLGFVAVLVAMVIAVLQGSVKNSISSSFSAVAGNMHTLVGKLPS